MSQQEQRPGDDPVETFRKAAEILRENDADHLADAFDAAREVAEGE